MLSDHIGKKIVHTSKEKHKIGISGEIRWWKREWGSRTCWLAEYIRRRWRWCVMKDLLIIVLKLFFLIFSFYSGLCGRLCCGVQHDCKYLLMFDSASFIILKFLHHICLCVFCSYIEFHPHLFAQHSTGFPYVEFESFNKVICWRVCHYENTIYIIHAQSFILSQC